MVFAFNTPIGWQPSPSYRLTSHFDLLSCMFTTSFSSKYSPDNVSQRDSTKKYPWPRPHATLLLCFHARVGTFYWAETFPLISYEILISLIPFSYTKCSVAFNSPMNEAVVSTLTNPQFQACVIIG